MANETTLTLIDALLPSVFDAALMHAHEATFMPQVVQTFVDGVGGKARIGSAYGTGSVSSLTDGTDITPAAALTRSAFGTLTPGEVGDMYLITDTRMESDNVDNILADAAEVIGMAMASNVEENLLGAFTSFTGEESGGTIGTATGTLTVANILGAAAHLRAAGVPGPYTAVIHEYQWYNMAVAAESALPLKVNEAMRAGSNYYMGSFGDINIYTTGRIASTGTVFVGGVFNRQAVGYDIRRGLRIESERDASYRATELVYTHLYGYGAWRTAYGVPIQGTVVAPS